MSGGTDLGDLLRSLKPSLQEGLFVFCTIADGDLPEGLSPRMTFRESEGTTLILLREEAEAAGLDFEFPCRMITLDVHSSLEAVGFMARIATALAGHGMGVNPVSGFYHDHLFVPDGREQEVLRVLEELARSAG